VLKALEKYCRFRFMISAVKKYGITRIDDEKRRTHCWVVVVQRKGKIWRRSFPDRRHGGKLKSLEAAREFRNKILTEHQPMTRAEYASIKRKNNRSGTPGVCRITRFETAFDRRVERHYWVAFWASPDGQKKQIKFSVDRYGERRAFYRAREARRRALAVLTDPWKPQ
jgi:hypothetical protein